MNTLFRLFLISLTIITPTLSLPAQTVYVYEEVDAPMPDVVLVPVKERRHKTKAERVTTTTVVRQSYSYPFFAGMVNAMGAVMGMFIGLWAAIGLSSLFCCWR